MSPAKDRPREFEPAGLQRGLDRYLLVGLAFMILLVAGFVLYRWREPSLRAHAAREQHTSYVALGTKLFADDCASCHGKIGVGDDAPRLNAREFLKGITDDQMRLLIAGGITGTDMSAWSIDFGGTLTDEQIRQLIAYIRSWEPTAPSVPNWRDVGKPAGGGPSPSMEPGHG